MKGTLIYLVALVSSILLLLSACSDDPEATSLTPMATSSHTGAKPAVHMQLKQDGEIICKVYNTSANTKPVVENCPNGKYLEQLFNNGNEENKNWVQIEQRDVTVGSTSNPEPDAPWNPGAPDPEEEPLRNPNPAFYQFKDYESADVPFKQLTEDMRSGVVIQPENPANKKPRFGAGNFRVTCQWSHFSYDDPIIKPGEIDGSHLHMFFGKTNTDYNTTSENVAESGGGTCNGFALNRSAYWVPALLNSDDKAVIPEQIIVYYKSSRIHEEGVYKMPQGLQLLGGNIMDSKKAFKPSDDSPDVFWSCGANGARSKEAPNDYSRTRKDDTKAGSLSDLECDNDEPINASIYFPQCVARINPNIKSNKNNVKLKSDDGDPLSHTHRLSARNKEDLNSKCPASHPVRIPELAILLYYPPQSSLTGWKLSSDEMVPDAAPGSTLHADWIGGWQDETMKLWVGKCNRAMLNCTIGQTGTKDNLKRALNRNSVLHQDKCHRENPKNNHEDCNNDKWIGPSFVTPPERRGPALADHMHGGH